jgi:hypothetical protein
VNRIDKATNEKVGMAALTLIMLTLFIFRAGTTVPLQTQTDPADAKVPPSHAQLLEQWDGDADSA